ncbi:MAG: outer membrane beta-barrel protein [Bacteroidota bacterium]
MKHFNLGLLLLFILSFTTLQAQNDTNDKVYSDLGSDSKFSIVTYGGVGYAMIDNNAQPDYNLNASTADILLHYTIGTRWGIATGIGFNQLSGNGFDNVDNNFYHERTTLKIPLLLSGNYNLSPKVRLVANIGFYAQTIVRDDFEFAGGTTISDVYEGWNFGLQSGIGLSYNFNQKLSLGIMFNTQGDFNRFDTASDVNINNSQRTRSVNTVGLLFTFNL